MKYFIYLKHLSSIAFLLLASNTFAQNVSTLISGSTTCKNQCPQNVQLGIAFEQASHAHTPRDDFYTIPNTFHPSMKPGTLLRVEQHTNLTNYTVPSSLTMSRIMYTSESLNGTIVPVSAYVLWPYTPFEYTSGKKSPQKFPLVAWAHGTSGGFVECAPSNYRSLQYHFMTAYSLALEGFAVIATDYAGLGVTTLPDGEQSHAWLAGPAASNDVAYSIDAVQAAFPDQLDAQGPFVAMGHSQGGNVAWAFAERQAKAPQAGYRGTVAFSPFGRVIDELNNALEIAKSEPASSWPLWIPVVIGLQPKIIAGITAVYPAYNFSGMTPLSYDRWNNVLKPVQGCLPTDGLVFADVDLTELAKPNWTADPIVTQWQDRVAVTGKKFKGPLLVIAGENDLIPIDLLEQSVDASCKVSGSESLEMITYSAMEHFPVIQASRMTWMQWIKENVGGSDSKGTNKKKCTCGEKSSVQGFNTNYTTQSTSPNWLVDLPSAQDAWELAL
ncbi:putative secretory lipase [Xylogone sp. PMI_703]|nr:putative secretory lipase [Xylogone sp. PMI_703]